MQLIYGTICDKKIFKAYLIFSENFINKKKKTEVEIRTEIVINLIEACKLREESVKSRIEKMSQRNEKTAPFSTTPLSVVRTPL